MAIRLADFVAPLTPTDFLAQHWTRKTFLGHLNAAAAAEVLPRLAGVDVRDLLKETRAPRCMLWFETPNGPRECWVPTKDAYAFYEGGATLFFNLDSAWAVSVSTQLRNDLGLPPPEPGKSGSMPSVFASRAGHGSKLHFDRFEILSIQLKGTKDWWIAPPALNNVDENFCVGDEQWPKFDPYRVAALRPPAQSAMRRLTLEPGSVLYLPRGHWHQTLADADSDSIALSFAFGPLTLRDVLLPLIDHVAGQDDRWRAWFGVLPEQDDRQACSEWLRDMSQRLMRLRDDLYPPRHGSHVTRNPLVSLGLTGEQEQGEPIALLKRRGTETMTTHVRVSQALVERAEHWHAETDQKRPLIELDDAERLLLEWGFLRPCGAPDA